MPQTKTFYNLDIFTQQRAHWFLHKALKVTISPFFIQCCTDFTGLCLYGNLTIISRSVKLIEYYLK